ncbi:hypothetical protein JCM11641_004344 [Rhodosporidiobolus odoratus]
MYRELNVRGIRLGNTFFEGRGTKNFSVVSIPDNQVLELTYNSNPSDSSSSLLTCFADCPLAHNSSVPTRTSSFQRAPLSPLLSEGAYAYAASADNNSPCASGLGASTQAMVETTGNWATSEVDTDIAGTVQSVLVASVSGGSSASSAPSITWNPVVSADGDYAVYFVTPSCSSSGTCGSRTTVEVTATPSSGTANSTTINQAVTSTTSTLIYNGTLKAGSDALSVSMTLAYGSAPNRGATYRLVANYINLVAASTNGSSTRLSRGYGLFEFPLVDSGTFGDAVPTAQALGVNASATLTNCFRFCLDVPTC